MTNGTCFLLLLDLSVVRARPKLAGNRKQTVLMSVERGRQVSRGDYR